MARVTPTLQQLRAEQARRKAEGLREALREHAVRYQSRGAFAAFVRLLWPAVEARTLEWAPYLDVVCHYLHRQMLGDPEFRRLLLLQPPGTAKSLLVSVLAPAYEWTFDPTRRKLYFAGDESLSFRDSRRTRIVLQSEEYQRLLAAMKARHGFTPWDFAADQQQKANFENTRGGFRQCLTLRSGVTGKRGDDFAIDDPIDVKAVIHGTMEAVLRRCHEANTTIDQALTTRVNDLRDARLTLMMQRLHEQDPAGHALREGGWKVLCLPLEYEPDHPHASPDDPRTTPGEVLHPARHTPEIVRHLTTKLGEQAAAQLQLRPTPRDGGRIRREWFRERYSCRPEDIAATADEVWITVDAAKKGASTSDFHAIHVWARKAGRRYLLHRRGERMGYPAFEQALDGEIRRWGPYILRCGGGVLIEDAANGTTYIQVRGPSYLGVALVAFSPSRDTPGTDKGKGARATYLERSAEAGGVILPESGAFDWVEVVIGWWCAFPRGAHDDDVDAASQLLMRWALEESQGDSWADVLGAFA